MNAEAVAARSAIESLRSGVPSRHAVALLGTTQYEVKERFEAALQDLEAGSGGEPIVISATFGAGKSHLLSYLQTLADREGLVSSFVVVSPEMPLGNPNIVLKTIAESAHAPGKADTALRALTANLSQSGEVLRRLQEWVREVHLDDRFRALLHLYEEYRADEEFRARILDDFEGKPLLKNDIRQKLKELGDLAAYDLSGPRNVLLAHDRIRLLAQFYRVAGGKGLVILFDELERIAKFSVRQRLAAYQELGWWRDIAAEEGSGILPVFAMTRGFLETTITGGAHDEQRLRSASTDQAQDERDQRALRGTALLKKSFLLETPTSEEEEEIKYRVKGLYERAYGEIAPALSAVRTDVRTTIRSEIRRWITLWDLHRYYPDYAPQMQSEEVHFDTTEIADDTLAREEDESE